MPQKVLYGPGVHIRHDWQRWIRHDFARWIKPGVDPADVIPALARERAERQAAEQRARAAENAALAAEIEHERRVLAALNEEVKELNAEMARRRRRLADEEAKYSPDQPRIPKRNPGGGQWTRIVGGSGQSPSSSIAQPMGNVDVGNLTGSSETEGLFSIVPGGTQDVSTLTHFADNGSTAQPIPTASPDDASDNLQDVNARRGGTSNWFPGASAEQQSRLDQAIARSENALTQIRQYDPDWQPREQSLTRPGSVDGAIARLEARATEAETRLDTLRTGIGGNRGPSLDPSPRGAPLSPRVFDGGAWIDAYRTINNMPDLFGRPDWPQDKGTVAVGKIDGQLYFGVNSGAPDYSGADRNTAMAARDNLINKYPDTMEKTDLGQVPNDALFHAESTILLRAANDSGGSLANRSIEIQVDRPVCYSCGEVLTKLGLELGDPYVVYVERGTGVRNAMWNGKWLSGRWK
ncbi:MAG: hypothetical protein QOH32_333 [Bradyrhizobium sp.]|jgi:hypothetical protein|nr:hypothetical protein [Bradyrhizobium sp.]